MPSTIRSPVDTILGEAVYGSRQERYADMLGIASVIDNRAKLGNVTPEDVVSAPGQFDAYGKSMPKGAEAYRGLAQQAWDQVQTIGPVTDATYYATPAAAKNLPGGLQTVDQTTGHVYQVDPQNRAFSTAKGFVQPAANAVAALSNKVAQTTRAIASGAVNVFDATIGRALPDQAPAPTGRPMGPGLAALAPNGLAGLTPPGLTYDLQGAQRSRVPTSNIGNLVHQAASSVIPGVNTSMFSGMEPPGRAPVGAAHRHPPGYAGDFKFFDPALGKQITDPVALQDIAMASAAKFGANIGFGGPGYMNRGSLHIDMAPEEAFGGGQQWGDLTPGLVSNLNFARETGIGPTPYSNAPTPFSREQVNPNNLAPSTENVAPSYAAPVGKVERAALGPAKLGPSGVVDNMLSGMESPVYGPGQVAPASKVAQGTKGAPTVSDEALAAAHQQAAQTRQEAGLWTSPVSPGLAASMTPSTEPNAAGLAAAYGGLGAALAAAGVKNLAGAPLSPPALQAPKLNEVAAVSLPAATPAPPAPAPAPPPAPRQVPAAPPALPPSVPRQVPRALPAPQATPRAPAAPPTPSYSPSDVYAGRAPMAADAYGNIVSRDQFGNTSITNKYGATTVTTPSGNQAATFGGPTIGAPSQQSAPTSKRGGLFGGLGNVDVGKMARQTTGAVAGSMLGGALAGPLGSMIGGAVGRSLVGGLGATTSPARGWTAGTYKGSPITKDTFPDAPKGKSKGGGWSPSKGLSDRAQRDVDRGTGGLY